MSLGEFEQIVLLALLRLGEGAYGMTVRQEIESRTGRDVSIGALYRTLARLESKGFVGHSLGAPVAERGGRAKKYYRVEAPGKAALERTRMALAQMWQGVSIDTEGGV